MNNHIKQSSWDENIQTHQAPRADWTVALISLVFAVVFVGLLFIGADRIFGAEAVTEFIGGLIS